MPKSNSPMSLKTLFLMGLPGYHLKAFDHLVISVEWAMPGHKTVTANFVVDHASQALPVLAKALSPLSAKLTLASWNNESDLGSWLLSCHGINRQALYHKGLSGHDIDGLENRIFPSPRQLMACQHSKQRFWCQLSEALQLCQSKH
ncbi:MAG: hypothetical protein VXY77_03315 [Pseudomonadota bacterium]|nr:hypothetical protein [Pseudomonadota bacterium]